jgi:hypothetical protein
MKPPFRVFLIIVVLSVAALLVGSSVRDALAQTGGTQQADVNAITVGGIGIVTADPDVAFFDISVERIGTNLDDVFASATAAASQVRSTLIGLGVQENDIKAQDFTVNPQDRINPQTGPTGEFLFRARQTLRITVRDVRQSEPLITAALNAGANAVANYTLSVSDLNLLETQARALAIADADERAAQFVRAFDVELGDPTYINEIGISSGFGATPATVADSTGRFTVTVELQITYRLITANAAAPAGRTTNP